MRFVDVSERELESWKEDNGVGLAVFRFPVSFIKQNGLNFRDNRYRILKITLDRRSVILKRIEQPDKPIK